MKPYLNLRQICLAAPDLEEAVEAVRATFGLEVCYRDPHVAKYGLVNALFVFGQAFLEIVAPTREGTAAGRFLERSGGVGGYMAIFDCSDPVARRDRAQALGVRIAHVLDYPGFQGNQFHPRDCRATMLEFDHTDGAEDLDGPYTPAGPDWRAAQRTDRVQGLPRIEVSSPQADDLAAHWSRLMDCPVRTDAGNPRLDFDLGAVLFTPGAPGTAEHLSALHVQVSDPDAVRTAALRHGLAADGEGFRFAGVRMLPVRA